MPIIIILRLPEVAEHISARSVDPDDPGNALQANDLTFSIGGVGEGGATEGHRVLSDLLVPPISSQCLRW